MLLQCVRELGSYCYKAVEVLVSFDANQGNKRRQGAFSPLGRRSAAKTGRAATSQAPYH